jgi:hypothetical protein
LIPGFNLPYPVVVWSGEIAPVVDQSCLEFVHRYLNV